MRIAKIFALLLLLCCTSTVQAKDSETQGKAKLQGFLSKMAQLESKARTIQPMHLPLQGRTRAQDQEMTRRIEFLDHLLSKDTNALGREVRDYQPPDTLQVQHASVRKTWELLHTWLDTKLTLQNAGVKNPGLESLKKKEPQDYQLYLDQRKQTEAALKN